MQHGTTKGLTRNKLPHLRLITNTATTQIPSTDIKTCESCKALTAVPFLQGHDKRPDGSFSPVFVIAVRYCPRFGKPIRGC